MTSICFYESQLWQIQLKKQTNNKRNIFVVRMEPFALDNWRCTERLSQWDTVWSTVAQQGMNHLKHVGERGEQNKFLLFETLTLQHVFFFTQTPNNCLYLILVLWNIHSKLCGRVWKHCSLLGANIKVSSSRIVMIECPKM